MWHVTSRLNTSRYRDLFHFFENINIDLDKLGLEKKSQYQSQKILVSTKSLNIGLENFDLKKSLGIGFKNLGLKKVSASFPEVWVSKKSHFWSPKIWSKKSLCNGLGISHISRWKVRVQSITLKVIAVLTLFSKEIQETLSKDFVS